MDFQLGKNELSRPKQEGLQSLKRSVTPPPPRKKLKDRYMSPTSAAVEAGQACVDDQVGFFVEKLLGFSRPVISLAPRIPFGEWIDLYKRNVHPGGRHFVVHQHDHPVAGTHYDLRLQCNETSSISFAIMYGLPGNPNSRRLNRNATETRVHCLWNHLIETASHSTGSMLIWDTGEYSVLPYYERNEPPRSDIESLDEETYRSLWEDLTEVQKLHRSFAQRKIRLRLHGTRLPQGYTLGIRLSKSDNQTSQPEPPKSKRRRLDPRLRHRKRGIQIETSESEEADTAPERGLPRLKSLQRMASPPKSQRLAASEDESEAIRKANAYPGALNDIGSIHQRRWYLSMDRLKSGFVLQNGHDGRSWQRRKKIDGCLEGFEKFTVLGREVERSVVTGRLAKELLEDEGIEGYVPRGFWRPVTE